MQGKTVMMTILLVSLVVAQVQVEAKSCCPNTTARNIYNVCRLGHGSRAFCAKTSGCKIISGTTCPTSTILEDSGNTVDEYCTLGCAFSVCGAITTLRNSGEVVNEAAEKCNSACSSFCTKSSFVAVETA